MHFPKGPRGENTPTGWWTVSPQYKDRCHSVIQYRRSGFVVAAVTYYARRDIGKIPNTGIRYQCNSTFLFLFFIFKPYFTFFVLLKSFNPAEVCEHMKSLSCTDAGRSLPPRAHLSPCRPNLPRLLCRSVAGLAAHLASRLQTWILGHPVVSVPQTILSARLDESAWSRRKICAGPSARTERTSLWITDCAAEPARL